MTYTPEQPRTTRGTESTGRPATRIDQLMLKLQTESNPDKITAIIDKIQSEIDRLNCLAETLPKGAQALTSVLSAALERQSELLQPQYEDEIDAILADGLFGDETVASYVNEVSSETEADVENVAGDFTDEEWQAIQAHRGTQSDVNEVQSNAEDDEPVKDVRKPAKSWEPGLRRDAIENNQPGIIKPRWAIGAGALLTLVLAGNSLIGGEADETKPEVVAAEYSADDYINLTDAKFDIASEIELAPKGDESQDTVKVVKDPETGEYRHANFSFSNADIKIQIPKQDVIDVITESEDSVAVDLSRIESSPLLQASSQEADLKLESFSSDVTNQLKTFIESSPDAAKEIGLSMALVREVSLSGEGLPNQDRAQVSATAEVLKNAIVDGGSFDARVDEAEAHQAIKDFLAKDYPNKEIKIAGKFAKSLEIHPAQAELFEKAELEARKQAEEAGIDYVPIQFEADNIKVTKK